MNKLPIYFAPLQGYTEDAFRRVHHDVAGGIERYLTPFIRIVHGDVRSKDYRDILHDHNKDVPVLPQLIAGDADEMRRLTDVILSEGYREINVNMGCPFPLQTRHGHGAGILPHPDKVEEILRVMDALPEVRFSIKMRLGLTDANEWRALISMFNDARLEHITLHPRIAAQQYSGEADMDSFRAFASECRVPLIYNGDIMSVADIERLHDEFPNLAGIMIGRGLLARPTLAAEYKNDTELNESQRLSVLLKMHEKLREHYSRIIPGEAAQLQKLRTFWDYSEPILGHKQWKKIRKAGNWRKYEEAVGELRIVD